VDEETDGRWEEMRCDGARPNYQRCCTSCATNLPIWAAYPYFQIYHMRLAPAGASGSELEGGR
jgi:hypothetical protein